MPPIKQTARKSTTRPSRPNIANLTTNPAAPIEVRLRNSTPIHTPRHGSTPNRRSCGQTPIHFGVGRGKGGIRRLRTRLRRCERSVDRVLMRSIRPQIRRSSEDSLTSLRRVEASRMGQFDIPLRPFVRIVKEIAKGINNEPLRIQTAALNALREASDAFMVRFFEQCSLYTTHGKRVTLMLKDIDLAKKINSNNYARNV